jgi:hypothetical protein
MKRQWITLGLACASVGLFAASVQAQEYRIETKIPFAFNVRDRACPAGVYEVQAASMTSYETVHNLKGKCSLFVNSRRFLSEPSGRQPRLVFRRYGQTYFLSRIWNGKGTGSTLPVSSREKRLQEATPPSEVATTVIDGVVGQ